MLDCINERIRERREQVWRGGTLPKGFTPIAQMRTLFYMGRWPSLADGSPGFFPMQTVLAMGRRDREQDADARVWLDLFDAATRGEAAAQLEMGKACEHGAFGAPRDVQRAFFWYYRAALQGNAQAEAAALRLKRAADIEPVTMDEPTLIHEGPWIVVMDNSGQGVTRNLFHLQDGGAVAGRVLEVGARYEGRWDYDAKGLILTFLLDTSVEGVAGPGSTVTLQIGLLGCNESMLFGRDRKLAGYTLQPAVGEEN